MKIVYLKYGFTPSASPDFGKVYTVTKTVNTARFEIGEEISRDTVKGLCDDAAYKVVITGK